MLDMFMSIWFNDYNLWGSFSFSCC